MLYDLSNGIPLVRLPRLVQRLPVPYRPGLFVALHTHVRVARHRRYVAQAYPVGSLQNPLVILQ